MKRLLRNIGNPTPHILFIGLLVLSLGQSRGSPYFWTGRNIANIFDQASADIILPVGMTFMIATVGIEMEVIAAVVLGGTDIRGGRGSAAGSLLACLFLALLWNGFVVMNVSARYQQLLMRLIVLAAVSVSEIRHGRRA